MRPLTARSEPPIAGGFGLIHGLAFSTLLKELPYPWVRKVGVGTALVLSSAWVVERLLLVTNHFAGPEAVLVEHLLGDGAVLAGPAIVVRLRSRELPRPPWDLPTGNPDESYLAEREAAS